ncbi:MAG TPA: hypothetical protein VLT57_18080 [Bryobacteraceae bacterium]|nr:hypothetical protein [Bryobacteraceae bacterium]
MHDFLAVRWKLAQEKANVAFTVLYITLEFYDEEDCSHDESLLSGG